MHRQRSFMSHASGEPYTTEYSPFSIFERSGSESEEMLTADRPRLCKCFTWSSIRLTKGDTTTTMGAIHSTKISGNFGLKLNGSVRSNRKSFEKIGPPFEVDHFSRLDRSDRNGPFHLTIPTHSHSQYLAVRYFP